jgi:hypothetical protein
LQAAAQPISKYLASAKFNIVAEVPHNQSDLGIVLRCGLCS